MDKEPRFSSKVTLQLVILKINMLGCINVSVSSSKGDMESVKDSDYCALRVWFLPAHTHTHTQSLNAAIS